MTEKLGGLYVQPLTLTASGILLVAIDWRAETLDLLPDPIGWILVANGTWRLWMGWPAVAAASAGLLSFADLTLPHRWVQVDPVTRQPVPATSGARGYPKHLVLDHVSDARALLLVLAAVLGGITLTWLGLALFGMKWIVDKPGGFDGGEWLPASLIPLLWAFPQAIAPAVGLAADGGYDPAWSGPARYIGIVCNGALLAYASILLWFRHSPWAAPDAWAPASTGTDHWGRTVLRRPKL